MKNIIFADLDEGVREYENSKVVILPVGYEGTVSYGKGTSLGAEAIIDASQNLELYDIELGKHTYKLGIHTLPSLECPGNPEDVVNKIHASVSKLLGDNKFVITLGGEHSITTGPVRAYKDKFPNLSVLQFDAHSDLRDTFDGSRYNHACVMSRVKESCPVVQVGIRSQETEEENIEKSRIFYAKDIHNNDEWMDKAIGMLSENVYVTFDLDALDPSIMPSTGTPEPGGLLWYQTIRFLRKVAEKKNIVGFDVVELAPVKGLHAPDFLAAKLVYKLIGYIFPRK